MTRDGHDVIVYVEKGGKAAPLEINPPRRLCISTSALSNWACQSYKFSDSWICPFNITVNNLSLTDIALVILK